MQNECEHEVFRAAEIKLDRLMHCSFCTSGLLPAPPWWELSRNPYQLFTHQFMNAGQVCFTWLCYALSFPHPLALNLLLLKNSAVLPLEPLAVHTGCLPLVVCTGRQAIGA